MPLTYKDSQRFDLGGGAGITSELVWHGDRITAAAHRAGIAAFKRIGREVIELAKEYAPFRLGGLRESGKYHVRGGTMPERTVSLDFTFDVPYADFQHRTHSTRSRYLDRAINNKRRRIASVLSSEIKRRVSRASPDIYFTRPTGGLVAAKPTFGSYTPPRAVINRSARRALLREERLLQRELGL